MPVYVYRNLASGETFEYEQRISEAALSAHPETGEPVKRLIQPVGIAFKGAGFYVTDSRADSRKNAAKKSDDKAESKTDSKTESKTESKGDSPTPSAKPDSGKADSSKPSPAPSVNKT